MSVFNLRAFYSELYLTLLFVKWRSIQKFLPTESNGLCPKTWTSMKYLRICKRPQTLKISTLPNVTVYQVRYRSVVFFIIWVTLCDWQKFLEKISKIQKDNLPSQEQLLEEQHQPPKTWCSNAKSKFARKPMKRRVQQQTRQEWQIHVMPDHTIPLVESEDQWMKKLKLSNFPRTVFQNEF